MDGLFEDIEKYTYLETTFYLKEIKKWHDQMFR
jgi:hypothetical protein